MRRPDRRRRPQPGQGHRASLSRPSAAQAGPRLRRLLPLLFPARSGRTGARVFLARSSKRRIAYIRAHPEIWEVILTGGDPLVLSARRLERVVAVLAAIEHVKVDPRAHAACRWPTPSRVTAALVRALKAPGKATYVVLHANHPRELTPAARAACARFIDAGIPMLSQSVLLARRQRRRRGAGRLDARLGRMPDQAVLPPPRRSRARHRALANQHRRGPGADARAARPPLRPLPTDVMCSTSPAATASRRSGRAISPASAAKTARRATRSRTSTAIATSTRRCGRSRQRTPCKVQTQM